MAGFIPPAKNSAEGVRFLVLRFANVARRRYSALRPKRRERRLTGSQSRDRRCSSTTVTVVGLPGVGLNARASFFY